MVADISGGQTLAVPGLFTYEKDSEDHLDPEDEQQDTGDTEETHTGEQQPQNIHEGTGQTTHDSNPPQDNNPPQ